MRALLGLPLIDKAAVIAACETPPDRLTARARPSTHDYAAISFYTGGRARIEQNVAQRLQPRLVGFRARRRLRAVENIVAFEIALVCHVVVAHEEAAGLRADQLDDLVLRPDVELALFAFRIGVERGGERALRRGHFALEPFHRLARAGGEKQAAGPLEGQRQQFEQLRVVVDDRAAEPGGRSRPLAEDGGDRGEDEGDLGAGEEAGQGGRALDPPEDLPAGRVERGFAPPAGLKR